MPGTIGDILPGRYKDRPGMASLDDDEEWTILSSIQRMDERTTLGKSDMLGQLVSSSGF